jgi:hypothetical protein
MTLAQDVRKKDDTGRVLCGKGIVLTESLIQRLSKIGILSIVVAGHPVTVDGEKSVEDLLAALEARFRRVENDPLMKKIKEIYRRRIRYVMGENSGRQTE